MKNVFNTIKADINFSTLASIINATELNNILSDTGPFTVFAPTNDAFTKIPVADLELIMKDKVILTKILTYHVVGKKLLAEDLATMTETNTLARLKLNFCNRASLTINDALVTKADIECSNGVIHVIDTVLVP